MSSNGAQSISTAQIVFPLIGVTILATIVILVVMTLKRTRDKISAVTSDTRFITLSNDKFLDAMEKEKPVRFTAQQLMIATDNFSNLLGSGGFGTVYRGIFSNGTAVAVKVLYGNSIQRIEEHFLAEVSTIGRVHHFNLVRLYGFCFESNLRALVYEYMVNGSLDNYLFHKKKVLGFEKLQEIAVGTAKGIAYLHEECQQKIVHYDIKPASILLDEKFFPKVADFCLAKLCDQENTHITVKERRGTPGYAAPELWMSYPMTEKCDVYSYGMLLFEVVGRRRNLEKDVAESQEWLPKWVWTNFENGELKEMMSVLGIEENDREKAEKMMKVALWCIQDRPEMRPLMSVVVKMLEGGEEIPAPLYPFKHFLTGSPITQDFEVASATRTGSTFDLGA